MTPRYVIRFNRGSRWSCTCRTSGEGVHAADSHALEHWPSVRIEAGGLAR